MPVVVGIGGDRELPSAQAIYAGEFANFLIVFDPADYVSAISDYSCNVEGVSLSLVPESENLLRVEVGSGVPAGSVADIKFKGQSIITLTCVKSIIVSKLTMSQEDESYISPSPANDVQITQSNLETSVLNVVVDGQPMAVNCTNVAFRDGSVSYDIDDNNGWSLNIDEGDFTPKNIEGCFFACYLENYQSAELISLELDGVAYPFVLAD